MAGDRVVEGVNWSHLVKVSISTTNEGPFAEDFFFVLHAEDGTGCVIANELSQGTDLLARLQQLPRFNNEAVMQASASTDNAEFLCWEGTAGEGRAAEG